MRFLGDFRTSSVVRLKFSSNSGGVPTTLSGTPAVAVYKDGSTTESTAGVTLTVDFDARTGLNHVAIDTSADATFYAAASDFVAVITAGTVGGISAVGYVVGQFSLENRSALMPTASGMKLDVSATGEAGLDFNNIKQATGATTLTNITVPLVSAVAGTVGTLDALIAALNTAHGAGSWATATGFSVPGSAMTLTSGERTSIANEVEAQIIDETDSEKVLLAITDKISAVNPSLAGLTIAAIASGVRTNLATELARIDVASSTRMATFVYTAPPTAAANASAVRTELTTELGRMDVAISSRSTYAPAGTVTTFDGVLSALATAHGAGSWATATGFSTLTAADVRAAVGLASANLDTQLAALSGGGGGSGSFGATQVSQLAAIAGKLPSSTYLAGSNSADGSVSAGSVSLDADSLAKLNSIYEQSLLITGDGITVLSPVSQDGGTITARAGDSWLIPLTGLGNISTRTALWFAVKQAGKNEPDRNSLVFVDEADGLTALNRGTYELTEYGGLTVSDATTGAVSIAVDEAATLLLKGAGNEFSWAIKWKNAAGTVATLATGSFVLQAPIIQAIE